MDSNENFQAEIKKELDKDLKTFGWHFMAKHVADYCNNSFFEILERSAMEIFSVVMIMQAAVKKNQHQSII